MQTWQPAHFRLVKAGAIRQTHTPYRSRVKSCEGTSYHKYKMFIVKVRRIINIQCSMTNMLSLAQCLFNTLLSLVHFYAVPYEDGKSSKYIVRLLGDSDRTMFQLTCKLIQTPNYSCDHQ